MEEKIKLSLRKCDKIKNYHEVMIILLIEKILSLIPYLLSQ